MTPQEEDRLAARARAGDPAALAELYRHLAPPILAFLVRTLSDRAEAEDVLHDTFLRLLSGRRRDTGRGRLRAWLFTVAGHLAVDRFRARQRRVALAAAAADAVEPPTAPDPGSVAAHGELLRRIEEALSDLPPAYSVAFHLRIREQLSYREIARILGDAEGTLRSRVHHTLMRLRRSLEESGYERPSQRAQEENTE